MVTRRTFVRNGIAATAGLAAGLPSLSGQPELKRIRVNEEDPLKNLPEITREDFVERQERAKEWMRKMKVDALLVEGGVNMSYFMDLSWWSSERLFGFLLTPHGETHWICPAFEKKRAEEVIKFGNEIMIWEEHESPYSLIDQFLKNVKKPGGTLGIGPNVRNFIAQGIRKDSRATIVDGGMITQACRSVKTIKELAFMEAANRITKLAYKKGFEKIKEGISPAELSGWIREAHSEHGVSGSGGPLFGENAAFPHGTMNIRNLREGDVILLDGGCSVNGYRSDVTRTIVYGKPSDEVRRVWDTVLQAQQAAFKLIKEGLPCEEADAAARKVVEKAGYGAGYENFTHRLGHGIGMEGHEYPYLVRGNRLKMVKGNAFTNEPGLYLYGKFGVRIEDSFAVTEEGFRVFGDMMSETIEKPF